MLEPLTCFANRLQHSHRPYSQDVYHLDSIRKNPETEMRILHNNTVKDLLKVDSIMMHGEIAYREGNYEEAFSLLRKAVTLQDNLNYDEPWGKMVPIRHALGGLLLEQGHVQEAINVFQTDLSLHPKNPWAVAGLISCLKRVNGDCYDTSTKQAEIDRLEEVFRVHKEKEWVDYDVVVSCECCQRDLV